MRRRRGRRVWWRWRSSHERRWRWRAWRRRRRYERWWRRRRWRGRRRRRDVSGAHVGDLEARVPHSGRARGRAHKEFSIKNMVPPRHASSIASAVEPAHRVFRVHARPQRDY
eukprot:6326068-Prymnesium_polylepis.2